MATFPTSETLWTAVRYCAVGVVNTIVALLVLAVGVRLGLHYTLYTALAYAAAFLTSFLLNARFTFDSRDKPLERFRVFLLVNLTNLGMVEVLQVILIEAFGVRELVGVAAGMVFYLVVGFLANRHFVFRSQGPVSVTRRVPNAMTR